MQICNKLTNTQTLTVSDEHTQFSTQETDPVVATEAVSLVFVEADKAVVFVILMDHVSCLVGWYAIMGFSLDKRKMNAKTLLQNIIVKLCDITVVLLVTVCLKIKGAFQNVGKYACL